MMTLEQCRARFAPLVQRPVSMRRALWLAPDALEWSSQYPGVLDAGPRAFDDLRDLRDVAPEPE
jgi:hypothetical protein